ncbi:MAG: Crp/Fnr family transcriptional regulator [Chloroflexi bacterium]|nr:Crp/Fnr family transcriptional regulator [Chloroflexota bacterium]
MINLTALTERMSRLQYFKGLSLSDLTTIVRSGHIRSIGKGSVIVSEDTPCAGLYVLLSGMVYCYRTSPEGQAVLVDELTPVTMFNEVAILDGGPNPMTVIAARDSLVWHADYTALLALSEQYPQVALGFLPILAQRTRVLITMVTDICFRSVRSRTAKLLLDLSDWGQHPISRQDHSIQKMATQISTAPEAISRALSYLRNEKCIRTSRATIEVCAPAALAELAQIDCLPEPEYHLPSSN